MKEIIVICLIFLSCQKTNVTKNRTINIITVADQWVVIYNSPKTHPDTLKIRVYWGKGKDIQFNTSLKIPPNTFVYDQETFIPSINGIEYLKVQEE